MKVLLVIVGMALVTYIPRLLPALFLDRFQFPAWFRKWLQSIPYAALGALIFPGVLLVEKDQPLLGLAGGLMAFLLSLLNLHITLVMAGSILIVILLQYFFF
ncbi:MAG: AzlD domain-containing protein [Anaerolineales bacterium]|nr:AzlD domain-containing protein [Anaerolineales bacterium]